jgi:very-short-patch-repair endonuclease
VAIEYQGQFHGAQYARDIARIERLRAAGWVVIQVSSELLFGNPEQLVRRVRTALSERGWRA